MPVGDVPSSYLPLLPFPPLLRLSLRSMRRLSVLIAVLASPVLLHAQELPRGVVIDPVKCLDDPSQTYALYLPTTYSAERPGAC